VGGAGEATMKPLERYGSRAAGQANAVGDLGDGTDVCKFGSVVGDKKDALFLASVDGERERRPRKDDDVVQGNKKKAAHFVYLHFR
jgi:hypothetical protein